MNSHEVISLYETVADITNEMLAAARNGEWDRLAELESRCASHVETLRHGEPPVALTGESRVHKVRIIQKILADDREIRNLTEPWMAQLSRLINSSGTERKLSQAYSGNQG